MAPEFSFSDHALLRQLQSVSEEEAAQVLETLIRRHYPELHRYALRKVGSPDVTDDILQEVFFRLWRSRDRISMPHSVIGYLFASVRNAVADFQIAEAARRRREEESAQHRKDVEFDSALSEIEQEEAEQIVRTAVAELPPRCREVFELIRVHGLSYPEAAAALGISLSTVKTQMSRAMAVLVRKIGLLLVISIFPQ